MCYLAKISRQNNENAKWLLLAGYDQIWEERDELNKKLFSFEAKFIGNINSPENLPFPAARDSQGGNDILAKI